MSKFDIDHDIEALVAAADRHPGVSVGMVAEVEKVFEMRRRNEILDKISDSLAEIAKTIRPEARDARGPNI